ncbi:phosphotransferase enzyme family protein [Ningiella sp. W23]|uniref:phosphotransferase enzyme family protein n=1 Tax=Ningiella sp. W23 TaxID=3023715 RepID=UPI003757E024
MNDELLLQHSILSAEKTARAFGFEDAEITLIKFRENAVFELRCQTKTFALRVHRPEYRSLQELKSEVELTSYLRDGGGINTPKFLTNSDGTHFYTSSIKGHYELHCDILEWIDGSSPNEQSIVKSFAQVGSLSARIHKTLATWTPSKNFLRPHLDETTLFGRYSVWGNYQQLTSIANSKMAKFEYAAKKVERSLSKACRDHEQWGLIHGDLMPENILINNNEISVIDFDDAGYSWYANELAIAIAFHLEQPYFNSLKFEWIKGYEEVKPNIDLSLLDDLIMARLLLALGWLAKRPKSKTALELHDYIVGIAFRFANEYTSK